MSSNYSLQTTALDVGVIYETEGFSSEEPPIENWSSLNVEIPEENVKRILYEKGLYRPGSGEVCAKYIALSASSVYQHLYYNYPPVNDPGIKEALFGEQHTQIHSNDGQELYLELCKEMGIRPIQMFYKNLTERVINLRYYGIHPNGFRPIAISLKNNVIVKVLDLTDNWISEDGWYHLSEMLVTNVSLEELNLHGCRIGPEGARILFANIHVNRTLRELNLTKNYITDIGVEYLSKAMSFGSNIINLNLSHNNLTSKSLIMLASAFKVHNVLTHLNLSYNVLVEPAAIIVFCNLLSENVKLKEIDLSWNSLSGPRIINSILKLMTAPNLRHLYLNNNRLFTPEVTQIAHILFKCKRLTTLDLSGNPLTPQDAICLLSCLEKRKVKVQNLFLENVSVKSDFIQLKEKILALKFRENAVIKHGDVIPDFISKTIDKRELILSRAEYLCRKTKKPSVDIALVILEICKSNTGPMNIKYFTATLKQSGVFHLDDDLIEEFGYVFPGPIKNKMKSVNLEKLLDYVHRKWPHKKLPPTPPEVEVAPQVKVDVKKQKKSKGLKK